MFYFLFVDIVDICNDLNLKLDEQVGLNVGYLVYNIIVVFFDKFEVCCVLNMVIDKKVIVDVVYQGDVEVVKNLILLIMWFYNDVIEDDKYDFEVVKVVLEVVGVLGLMMEVWVMLVQCFYMFNVCCIVEMI